MINTENEALTLIRPIFNAKDVITMVQAKSELRRIFTEKLHRMHILFALLFIRCHCSCVLANQNFFEQNELSEGWPVSSPLQININSEVNLVLAPLTQQCMQQIVSLERSCYARYLDAYSELTKTAVTNDYSSVVDGKVSPEGHFFNSFPFNDQNFRFAVLLCLLAMV